VLRFDDAASKANGASANGVLGQPSFASNDFATTASGMNAPGGVAVDSAGQLWVADTGNSRVLRFDDAASKANGASANGVLGQPSFASNDFATTASGMWTPKGVTVGSAGRVWVADTGNNRVLRFDDAASKADGASADGVLGQIDFTSRATATTASGMNGPYGVAVDSTDRLWIVDHLNNRVLRFNGTSADVVLGQSDFTSSVAATSATGMLFPRGVAVDNVGSIWVADGSRVLRFAHMIAPTITWANPATITYGTPLSAAQLNASADVPGSFSYSPPLGTVLNVGMGQPLSVTFTPTDSANYTPVSKTVTIDVVLRLYLPPIRH
jgi:sugar lactone lactonase YvrE